MTKATARHWAVMAAPLVELSLLAPEVRGSNPISDITEQFSTNFNLEKMKVRENETHREEAT